MDLCPLTPVFGVEIPDVQLARCSTDFVVEVLRPALWEHKLLVFRGQAMAPDTLARVAAAMGMPERFPDALDDHPENIWHSDMSFLEAPPTAAVLRATVVPRSGGDTLFADMGYALEGLPDDLRCRAEQLDACHDVAKWAPADMAAELRSEFLPVAHPVVTVHPETGEHLLYVDTAYTTNVIGLDADESASLLARLFRQVLALGGQCRVRWTDDTVAIWDTRALQRYTVGDYVPSTRVVERISVGGERPVPARSTVDSCHGWVNLCQRR